MAFNVSTRSIPEILTDVVNQFSTLLSKEGQLARAELAENIAKAAAGLGLAVFGAVLLIPAVTILLAAAVIALNQYGLAAPLAAVAIGGAVFIIGVILLFLGIGRLKAKQMLPSRTLNQLQRDASTAKDQMRQKHELHPAA
jgi:putative superfamily III holin-X